MTTPKKPRGPVVFGPESLERVPPGPDKARAAGAPPASKLVKVPRCPLCRQRAATEVIDLGVVHVRTCPPCAASSHAALRIFSVVKTLF